MATHRIIFTKVALAKIVPPIRPEGKQGGVFDTYYDLREKGLVLLVSNGGAKTYYLYAKVEGRPERIKLGAFEDISIEQARKSATKHRGDIAEGTNPQQAKRAFKQEATFKELFDEYMERYSKKQKRSWQYDEREVNKFLSHWFKRKISSITTQEIRRLHKTISDENGLYQANRLLERIRAIYNKAIEWGWQGSNPAAGIKKFKERARDRFLQPHELPYFFEALAAETNIAVKDYIMLSLLTGARKANMLAMRWDEISLEQRQWRIPETKNGEPVLVALSPQAMEILQTRKKPAEGGWVFPSVASSKGHLQDPKKAWQRLLKRAEIYQLVDLLAKREDWKDSFIEKARKQAEENLTTSLEAYRKTAMTYQLDSATLGLPDLRIHDLRRSLGSWQAVTGASSYVIGKSLGHKSQQATAIYARLNLDPVRASVERATDAMLAAGKR
jgi:integrase